MSDLYLGNIIQSAYCHVKWKFHHNFGWNVKKITQRQMSEWVESRKIENMNEWEFLNPPLGLINYWPFWVKTKTNLVHTFFIGSLYILENIKYFSKYKEKQNHQTNQNRIWLLSLGWRIINLNLSNDCSSKGIYKQQRCVPTTKLFHECWTKLRYLEF